MPNCVFCKRQTLGALLDNLKAIDRNFIWDMKGQRLAKGLIKLKRKPPSVFCVAAMGPGHRLRSDEVIEIAEFFGIPCC